MNGQSIDPRANSVHQSPSALSRPVYQYKPRCIPTYEVGGRCIMICPLLTPSAMLDRDECPLSTFYTQSFSYIVFPTGEITFVPHGDAQPPATSTHSARQLPCLPSTSTMSVSHLHRQPTPFSFSESQESQYSSSSLLSFSSSVVVSRNFGLGSCRATALAGQCWMVVCRYPKSRK